MTDVPPVQGPSASGFSCPPVSESGFSLSFHSGHFPVIPYRCIAERRTRHCPYLVFPAPILRTPLGGGRKRFPHQELKTRKNPAATKLRPESLSFSGIRRAETGATYFQEETFGGGRFERLVGFLGQIGVKFAHLGGLGLQSLVGGLRVVGLNFEWPCRGSWPKPAFSAAASAALS